MSVRAITAAWQVSASPTLKLLLLALADHANDENYECWPSLTHLCKKTGLARSTVARLLSEAEGTGLITRTQRGQRSTIYRLNIDRWSHSRTSPTEELDPGADPASPSTGLALVREPDGGSPRAGPGTVIEPSVETSPNRGAGEAAASEKRDLLWEAVLEACGVTGKSPTKSERGGWNKAVKEIRDAGGQPGDVPRRADRFRAIYPGATLTPTALARHWGQCAASRHSPRPPELPELKASHAPG